MDRTERKITKIAREAEKLVLRMLRAEGVGTAEIDLIHALRHNPGCTQAKLAEILHADKAAIARRTKNLEEKGYLVRRDDPEDRPERQAQSIALSHRAGGKSEIVKSGDRGVVLRIPDLGADRGGGGDLCRTAGPGVHRLQDGEPRGLPALHPVNGGICI